ncbi:MAG: helix-turn-helix transcriptional regulator [Polyangiaceae bacterium]
MGSQTNPMLQPMTQAHDTDDFLRNPLGRWVRSEHMVGWCQSPSLCGATLFGCPDADSVLQILRVFDAFKHPEMASQIGLVIDARQLHVNMDAFEALATWLNTNRNKLKSRIRIQAGIVGTGVTALVLTGILPLLGGIHPFLVFNEPGPAFDLVAPGLGRALADQVSNLVCEARQVDPVLGTLHQLMERTGGSSSIAEAARKLHVSKRTLQRKLTEAGDSFRELQQRYRVRKALELLRTTSLKVASVADRVGVSERGLNKMVHVAEGVSPAEYRRRKQAGG